MIPVYEPLFKGNEKRYLEKAINEGEISSTGRFVNKFEEAFASWSGNEYAVALSSGTAAIETGLWSTNYPRNEISIPNGTIISCFNAAVRAGYKVLLHDNDSVGSCIGIMSCHLFGSIDRTEGLTILDDLSQYWVPKKVDIVGAYSLYANKLITSGEGGVVVTNEKSVYEMARSYRNLCHSSERFVHNSMGYNYRMSNIQAALALAQLEQINHFVEIKQRNRNLYLKYLPSSVIPLFDVDVPWMYLIETPRPASLVVQALRENAIEARRFFHPINEQPFIKQDGHYPVSKHLWNHALYLPSGLTLTEGQIISVSKTLCRILQSLKSKKAV